LHTLERSHDIGREGGLDFVYLGNVLGHWYENTYVLTAARCAKPGQKERSERWKLQK